MSQSNNNDSTSNIEISEIEKMIEIASSTSDYFTQNGNGANLKDISLNDLYTYLRNPYANIKQIRNTSKYLSNKHGLLRETHRAFKSLPTLDYMISWSDYTDEKKIKKYEKKVYDFIKNVGIKSVVRDGLFQVSIEGTIVLCNRNNKYIQFLEIDDLKIDSQRNGRWNIQYDLQAIDKYAKTLKDKTDLINSLPPEITIAKYNLFKEKGSDYRYVELKKCRIIGIDTYRNYPFGLPYTLGAWNAILQKELIDKVERSVASNMLKQIILLKAGFIDKNNDKLVPKEVINAYFNNISKVLTKNSPKSRNGNQNHEDSGIGLISLLQGLELETLDINTETFKKELYDKINNDIFMSLGISEALLFGGSKGSYSSAQLNSEKFFRYVYETLEKFEDVINEFINDMLPKDLTCTFTFLKTSLSDKKNHSEELKNLYLQTGASKYWLESVTGLPYQDVLNQVEYERNVLRTDDILNPPDNFYNQSGKSDDKGGRPESDSGNDNTVKSRNNNSNGTPKPSTS